MGERYHFISRALVREAVKVIPAMALAFGFIYDGIDYDRDWIRFRETGQPEGKVVVVDFEPVMSYDPFDGRATIVQAAW